MKHSYNRGGEENFLPVTAVSNTNPVTSDGIFITDFDDVGIQLVTTGLSGSWKVECSNDYVISASNITAYGEAPAAGTWTDITARFSPAIVTVVSGTAATENQYVQIQLTTRYIRVTFTPTGGSGNVKALGCCKSRG